MSVTREVALYQDLLRRHAIHLDEPVRWKPGELDLGRAGDKIGLEHKRPASFELSSRDEKEERIDGRPQPTRLIRIVGTERRIQLVLDLVLGKERQAELARERLGDRRLAACRRAVDENEKWQVRLGHTPVIPSGRPTCVRGGRCGSHAPRSSGARSGGRVKTSGATRASVACRRVTAATRRASS